MKKIAISIALVMVSVLAACSAKERETMKNTASNNATVTAAPTATATPTPVPATPTPAASAAPIDYKNAKLIALTFDDGPTTQTTPLVLDKLEKYGVVASFFLIGSQINDTTKPLMERELKLGCEINNHSWSHSDMSKMTEEKVKKEIDDTSNKIKETVGVTPKFFRPPFILTSATMYKTIDLPFINGINCNDWTASVTADQRATTILNTAKDGNIILMHDFVNNANTVNALDKIIPGLKAKGFVFVTVSQLFEYKGVDTDDKNQCWSLVTK